jgi:hypothetical protein
VLFSPILLPELMFFFNLNFLRLIDYQILVNFLKAATDCKSKSKQHKSDTGHAHLNAGKRPQTASNDHDHDFPGMLPDSHEPVPATSRNTSRHANDRASLASTTSTSSNDLTTATALSSATSKTSAPSATTLAHHLTSLMSSASGHPQTGSDLVPVAFLPIGLVLPAMMQQQQHQSKYDAGDNNTKSLAASLISKSSSSSLNMAVPSGLSPSTSIISNMSSMSSGMPHSLPSINMNDLPHVELSVASVEFGHIAEGCCTSTRLTLKVTPNSASSKSIYFLLEFYILWCHRCCKLTSIESNFCSTFCPIKHIFYSYRKPSLICPRSTSKTSKKHPFR